MDDSVERDLPASLPKATIVSTPTKSKTSPLLAHIGKSRYSSDARPIAGSSSSKPGSIQRRKSATADTILCRPSSTNDSGPGPSAIRRNSTTRRSTHRVKFGSATIMGDDNSTTTKTNSLMPDGYEVIERENKRALEGLEVPLLLIIYNRNGKKYCRKYCPQGSGYYNERIACIDYYCKICKAKGKETLLKVICRNGNTYAQTEHHPECEMKDYNLEDEDE